MARRTNRAKTYYVIYPLRMVEIPAHVATRSVLRMGRWKEGSDSEGRDPRPTSFELTNTQYRDRYLAANDRIKTFIREEITIKPDDLTIDRTKSKDTKSRSAGLKP